MATVKDTRLLNVGMDKDSDDRFVEQGRYREARNVRLISMAGDETFDPEAGKIHSADGHSPTLMHVITDSGDVCHGAFKNPESGMIYLFYAGSVAANNKIVSFDETTSTPALIIESSFLEFNRRYPILDVFVVDDILIFNDALNSPRKINLTGSYTGLDIWEFNQVTNIIQKPPLYSPTISVGTDTNYSGNNIVDKFFQFKYRYIYADGEKSVFSPISEPAYSEFDQLNREDIDTSNGTHNMISIIMPVDHANVEDSGTDRFPQKIELAVRQGNNGDFFLVDTIDCSAVSTITYSFYNDGTYTPIPLQESNQLMDDVPLVAGSVGFSNGRLIFGDVTRGFDDSTTLDLQPSVIYRDQPVAATTTGTSTDTTILDSVVAFEAALAAAPWNYTFQPGDKITVTGINSTDPLLQFGVVVVQSKIGETIEDVYNQIIETVVISPVYTLMDLYYTPEGTYENEKFKIDTISGADAQLGFKSGEWYRAGLLYEDEWGRQQGIYSDPAARFYVPTIPERYGISGTSALNAGLCAMGFLINHRAPIWATRYKLAITPERVKARSIMLTISNATEPSTDLFEMEIATLQDYAARYDNTNFVYSYSVGDRIRLIRKGVLGNWYTDILDAEIIKYVEKVGVDAVTTVPHIQANFPSSSVILADLEGALVEIYSPSLSIDSDDGIWYEIPGTSNSIVSRGHSAKVGQAISQASSYINKTPDGLIIESGLYRVRFLYSNADLIQTLLPSIGANNMVISGTTTDVNWNDTWDVVGYLVSEAYVDVVIDGYTGSPPTSDDTTPGSLASCADYYVNDSPAVLPVSAFNAYGRTRNMIDEYSTSAYQVSDHYIESLYMNDFSSNSNIMFIGRPAIVFGSRGEKRDIATVVYTEPYIFNTEINGLGRVYPDVNFEEYDKQFGAITKLFKRDDGILMLQEYKVSRLLVGRDMIFNADGGGQMTTASRFLSKQIPLHGEYGCRRPESFASFGNYQFFFDTINGAPIVIAGDQMKDIADTGMMKWFKGVSKTIEDYNAVSARRMLVFGEYDGLYDEYVISIKDTTGVRTTDTLVFWMKSQTWLAFMDYDPDYLFRSHDRMIIAGGEYLWRVAEGVPGYLMGTYRDSIIEMISNVDPSETKNFMALDMDAIKAPATVEITTEDNQISTLLASDFVKREGRYQSYILRDTNTPNVTDPLLNGDVLKAKSAKFKFTFKNYPNDGIKLSTVTVLVSKA